jgi:hypothetical protein
MSSAIQTTRRGLALAVLCSAFFMVALDVAVTNVALPSISRPRRAQSDLQCYHRLRADARRLSDAGADSPTCAAAKPVLMAGLTTFALASLAAGLRPASCW